MTSAALVFGYVADDYPYYLAQIGGANEAFALIESVPKGGFKAVLSGGQASDVVRDAPYRLSVALSGQQYSVSVNSVPALRGVLPAPLAGQQVGLLASGDTEVRFAQTYAAGQHGRAFVVMKFKDEYFSIYREAIKDVIEGAKLRPILANEIYGPRLVLNDIRQEIERARVVVAEISAAEQNENVFFEIGYALALKKPTILMAERSRKLPFDISGFRVVYYDDTIAGKKRFEDELRLNLEAALSEAA